MPGGNAAGRTTATLAWNSIRLQESDIAVQIIQVGTIISLRGAGSGHNEDRGLEFGIICMPPALQITAKTSFVL